MVEDEHTLLTQLISIKKQAFISTGDFVANFNKITNRIPVADRPTLGNLKTFFISVMPLDINYDLRRACLTDWEVVQRTTMELEDDMILVDRWKCEIQTKASSSGNTSLKEMIQKLSNELIVMKK